MVAIAQENMLTLNTFHEEFEQFCEHHRMSNGVVKEKEKRKNFIA